MARRSKGGGRYWLAFWLAVFFVVAAVVLLRQSASYAIAARLGKLKEAHGELEARQAVIRRRIEVASTAQTLLPKVARLGLSAPSDTSTTYLRPADATRSRTR